MLEIRRTLTADLKHHINKPDRNFLEAYQPEEGWVINRSLRAEVNIGTTTVKFIPWYDLM